MQPVLITTQYRGVFFGYLPDTLPSSCTLANARNCLYWSTDMAGFLGLATRGPTAACNTGPVCEKLVLLYNITSIAKVTPDAERAWKQH